MAFTFNLGTRIKNVGGGAPAFTNVKSSLFNGVDEFAQDGSDAALRFSFNSPFSVSTWVKFTQTALFDAFYSSRAAAGNNEGIELLNDAGKFRFRLMQTGTKTIDIRTTIIHSVDTWFNVICTYDGSKTAAGCNIYVGSVLRNVITIDDDIDADITYTQPFTVGARPNATFTLSGNQDELSAYDIELSQANVNSIGSGSPNDLADLGFGANLTAWYRMGDGDTSPTILDQIASNDLTTTNMDSGNFVNDVA